MNWLLVSQLGQEGQKQTLRSIRQVSKETGLRQHSIVQIIHRDLVLKCLVYQYASGFLLFVFLTFIHFIFHTVV